MPIETEFCNDNRLHPVAVEQDPDHVLHGGLLIDQEALILNFHHENAIVKPHQASLLYLRNKLTLSSRVATDQLRGSGVVGQYQGPGDSLSDHHLHA